MSGLHQQVFTSLNRRLEQRAKRSLYVNDPVAWAKDILDVDLWSMQQKVAFSVRDNRNTAVAAAHGVGKDLPLSTPIPTPSGWSTIGALRPGDLVFDENGNPCRVVGKSEVFNLPLYEVTFSDGAKVRTSSTHEWNTIDHRAARKARRAEGGVQDWRDHWSLSETRETGEIRETLHYKNGANAQASNHIIPNARALEMPERELPLDPYVVGAWLGDGTSVRAEMTIGADGEYIIEEFAKVGYSLTKTPEGECRYTFARQGFVQVARGMNMMNNKHIPSDYQRASIAQRKELLRGLMDTDGFLCHDTTCGLDLMNEELARDAVELIRGLGVRATITPSRTYLDGRDVGTRYRIVFNPTWSPFTPGQYKDLKWQERGGAAFFQQSRRTMRTIVSVEPVESVPTQCIQVDSESHLYLATEDLIPTHNSFLASVLACWWIDVHPQDEVFFASTAPFQSQISAILWKGIRVFHTLAKRRYAEGLIDHPLPGYITGDNEWKTDDGIIIGQGRKPPDSQEDSGYQGLHAVYLLAIGDEAAGLSAGMVDALGNITTGGHNRLLLIANPTDPTSAMAKLWKTKNPAWNRMHISAFDSPKITGEDFPADRMTALTGWEYINEKKADWGESDPRYISRVTGQWAFDAGNTVFADTDIAKAANCVVIPDPAARPRHGWDIARSKNGDYTVGYRAIEGEVWETDDAGKPVTATGRTGLQVRFIDKWQGAPLVGGDPGNPGSATRIDEHALGEGAYFVAVDSAGLGSGVIDGLRDLGFGQLKYPVFEYYGSGPSTDRRSFVNQRAQHYFAMKDMMFKGELDLDPDDETLLDELRGILYEYDTRGSKKIESKDDMRRHGKKSPDFADAAIYASFDISEIAGDAPLAGMKVGDAKIESAHDYAREVTLERRARRVMPV